MLNLELRGGVGQGSLLKESLDRCVQLIRRYSQEKDFQSSDDQAWSALRLVGLGALDRLYAVTPEEHVRNIPAEMHSGLSEAFTAIGMSFNQIRERYHRRAFLMFELAWAFDPTNQRAVMNMGDLAVSASEERMRTPLVGDDEYLTSEQAADEIQREQLVALESTEKTLRDIYGIGSDELSGTAACPKLQDTQLAHAAWMVSNYGRLMLHIARWDSLQPDGQRGEPFFEYALNGAHTVLELHGLSRGLDQNGATLAKALKSSNDTSASKSRRIAEAFSLVGSVYYLRSNFTESRKAFQYTVELEPNHKFATDRLRVIEQHAGRTLTGALDLYLAPAPDRVKPNQNRQVLRWQGMIEDYVSKLDSKDKGFVKQVAENFLSKPELLPAFLNFAGSLACLKSEGRLARDTFFEHEERLKDRYWELTGSEQGYVELLSLRAFLNLMLRSNDSSQSNRAKPLSMFLEEVFENCLPADQLGLDEEHFTKAIEAVSKRMLG